VNKECFNSAVEKYIVNEELQCKCGSPKMYSIV